MSERARKIDLEPGWLNAVGAEFDKPYMADLREFLLQRGRQGRVLYPAPSQWFAALNHTPFDRVRVVILGQDPYHGPGQAHGLCFSVQPGIAVPPSLQNMFKELQSDLGIAPAAHGCLTSWAEQGVLLLNAVLTVERGNAGAHQGRGWETFTDAVVAALNARREGVVFLLWGAYAQRKGKIIDRARHHVLQAPHPSPLSAHRGFFGCGHFSETNRLLEAAGERPIDWALPAVVTDQSATM